MRRAAILAAMVLAAAPPQAAAAQTLERDFSFGRGRPFAGAVVVDNVCVTLATTNTEPFGRTAFRDLVNTEPAQVTLTFGAPIAAFHLDVSRLREDELITDFNIGLPTALESRGGRTAHSLVIRDGSITTGQPGDHGQGRLAWTGLRTDVVRFTIWNVPGARHAPALAVDAFGFVPLGDAAAAGAPPPACPPESPAADAGDAAGKPGGRAGDASGQRRKLPIRDSSGWGVCGDRC